MGLARERENLLAAGFSPRVIATIQSARTPSTRAVYDGKWNAFLDWCEVQDPPVVAHLASAQKVLDFLQDRLDLGLAFSTLRGYLAAIDACHLGVEGKRLSKFPEVVQFMHGVDHLRPVTRSLFPSWDLQVVLEGLCKAPFEPLERSSLKHLSFKTALLLALATAKRVSDLHALSVSPDCLSFLNNGTKVLLKPKLGFVPKNRVVPREPVVLTAFHPPPFASEEDRRLHCLCPVRALKAYCDKTVDSRSTSQLFVVLNARRRKAVSTATLSRWIVEAIRLAYSRAGVEVPEALKAHSTRGMSASWALSKGISVEEICAAANWSSPSTFATYYHLDIAPSAMAHVVLGAAASTTV